MIKCTVVTVGEPSDWEVGSGKWEGHGYWSAVQGRNGSVKEAVPVPVYGFEAQRLKRCACK